ncbi:MAG: hypothetical protein ACFCVF_07920 [Kineosporiaceae bacterium]
MARRLSLPGGRLRAVAAVCAALVVCAALSLAGAAPAAAAALPALPIPGLPDCQGEPTPQSPDRGFNGYVTPTPTDPPPVDADPFASGATVSVYETTGLAGYRWHMYVDSCVAGPGQATNQALTSSANALMAVPVLCLGVVATLADVVYNQRWLDILDQPVGYVSEALMTGFTEPFLPVVLVAVGLVLLVSIRRARLSAAIGTVVLALVATTLATFAASYPTRVSQATDDITAGAVSSISGALAGSRESTPDVATVSPLVEAMLYDRWVAGTLGDTTSPTAQAYGPQLYRASTLSWAEVEVVRSDPDGAGAELLAAKQEQWEAAAAAVERTDPDSYEYLTGARSIDRVGHAIVALALIAILPFLVVSLVLVALSYLIIRIIVMFLPLVALVALLVRGTLSGVASLAAAAVVNSIVFAVGAAVAAYLFGVFLSPDSGIPALLGILLAFLVSVAMWILLSPYRRLTRLVRSRDAVSTGVREAERLGGGVKGFAAGVGKVALGVFAGRRAAEAASDDDEDEDKSAAAEAPTARGVARPEHSTVDGGGPSAAAVAEKEPEEPPAQRGEDRPETARLQDFDPVVVDGDEVIVVYTLDGPVVDARPESAEAAADPRNAQAGAARALDPARPAPSLASAFDRARAP